MLTAYALGELDDGQRAEIEARLRESADERQAVDDLARLGKLLRNVAAQSSLIPSPLAQSPLTHDSLPDRSSVLRQAVLAQLANPPQSEAPLRLPERLPRRRFWLPLSLAASLAVTCGTLYALIKTKHVERAVATHDARDRSQSRETSKLDLTVAGPEAVEVEFAAPSANGVSAPIAMFGDELGKHPSNGAAASGDTNLGLSDLTLPAEPDEVARGSRTGTTPKTVLTGRIGGAASPAFGVPGDESRTEGMVSGPRGASADSRGMVPGGMVPPGRPRSGGEGRGERSGAKAGEAADPGFRYFTLVEPQGAQQAGEARDGEGQDRGGHGQSGEGLGAPKKDSRGYFDDGVADRRSSSMGMQGLPLGERMGGGKSGGGQRDNRGQDQGQAQPGQDLQRQQIAAEGQSGERINRELFLQKRREQEGFAGAMGGGAMGAAGGMAMGGGATAPMQPGELPVSAGYGGIALQNAESYPPLVENPFRKSTEYPLSTFSVDVDTASYTNVRRFLNSHAMPPRDAVRVEELINYFQYSYAQPDGDVPFSITTDVADCPWHAQHRLLRVGLKGRDIPADQRPASNLVFLLDVSGSMDAPNKLPLVKEAMYLLVDKLTENDRVAIVVYAGNSGLVLPPTNGQNKETIRAAISQLVASGSTNGGQGLQMAYETALSHFIKGGTNRVILATDGDFNVGVVDQDDLVRLIEEKAKGGVFLSTLGFGIGNLKDGTLEKLADKGNGNYAYIDTLGEARRVLVEQLSGTLVTIAKDVKLQIEFNPAQAAEYRLIGYEDRLMPQQDFHDDRKDAGEIGAGHSVTALYEIVPAATVLAAGIEPLKYQRSENANPNFTAAAATGELATIKLRFKEPDGQHSRLIERAVTDRRPPRAEASQDMSFAAAVAAFGMLLRDSPYRGDASYQKVLSLAEQGLSSDPNGYRSEFVQLVRQARQIAGAE